jgi:tellurite resistance protein TerC
VHIKDLMLADQDEGDLTRLCRQYLNVKEDQPLESLLSEMQRRRVHVALVHDTDGNWTGFLTLEDVIEEIIGTIRDEFEDEEQISLYNSLDERFVHLGLEGNDMIEVVRNATMKTTNWNLPVSREQVIKAIDERERAVSTYLGKGLAMPHARLAGLQLPIVMFIRSEDGIPYRNHQEKAYLVFVLLTPAGQPRVHQRLQSVIATILDESEFVTDHLRYASSPAEVVEILRTGEQASLD